jgi:hypothetical protein
MNHSALQEALGAAFGGLLNRRARTLLQHLQLRM